MGNWLIDNFMWFIAGGFVLALIIVTWAACQPWFTLNPLKGQKDG